MLGLGETRKARRGLINGLGSIAKSLSGTMDDDDAKEIHERLNRLEQGQAGALDSTRKQIEILNSTIYQLEQTEAIIQRNEEQLVNASRRVFDYLYKADTEIIVHLNLQEYFSILEAVTNGVRRDGERLRKVFTWGRLLETGVISEQELVESLRRAPVQRGSSFPFDVKVGGMHTLQEVSTVSVHQFGNKIVRLVEIPLVSFDAYDVMLTHGIPTRSTAEYRTYIEAENEVVAIHQDTQRYIPITLQQLQRCKKLKGQFFRTKIFPTQVIRPYSPCEVRMFIGATQLPGTCTPKHISLERLLLMPLNPNSA
uniref:Uncharacterized protein n=1 Tax=Bracon brevicornis TaxID=1563983 RepID=A0A6V7LX74_9HYME